MCERGGGKHGLVADSIPEPNLAKLRYALHGARAESGLTLEQLAERSGVSRQTLLNLGSGKYYGDLKTWLRISRALEVGLDELTEMVWDE